ncbi:hypothetical protein HDV01_005814 [Terramyces sp. JEL0728]|nr:hypothetical protein HDV01_005814 [Terramyces sp. JEL0728]
MKFILLFISQCLAGRAKMKLPNRNTIQVDKVTRQYEALTGGTGPTLSFTPANNAKTYEGRYGDNSYWIGYEARLPIQITGTVLQATSPILIMYQQSTDPIFSDGQTSNGLMGIGFGSLASISDSPLTVMEALYSSGAVSKNQIAIHGCPYAELSSAFIDFGNTRPYSSCSSTSVTVNFPYESYYTVDVRGISIGGTAVKLPTTFQGPTSSYVGERDWSIFDSCTSLISIPTNAFTALETALKNSNGLPAIISSPQYINDWLNGNINIQAADSDFKWSKLPTLDFSISTGGNNPTLVHFILGPQQYIQPDPDGYYSLLVYNAGDDNSVIFGLPFFSAFHLVADFSLGQATISLGCSCSYSTDGYPQIVVGNSIATVPTSIAKKNVLFTALLSLVISSRVSISLPDSSTVIVENGIAKQTSSLAGGFTTCFLASLTANNQTFLVQVDTGSSDTALPATGLNNYNGPAIPYSSTSMGTSSVSDTYGDGSSWAGYQTQYTVTVTGTNITGSVPIALMTSQSTSRIFIDGSYANGLVGLGFPILAAITLGNRTIIDAYLAENAITKNQVGIYGCPYSQIQHAWMDIGNTLPYTSCSNIVATISMPFKSFYNIDVQSIQISGVSVTLPPAFQSATNNMYGGRYWSFLDSCNSAIDLPSAVVGNLQSAIRSSGGLPSSITNSYYYNQWLGGQVRMAVSLNSFQWSLLPNISITVSTGDADRSLVVFVLGPQQYIQADANGYDRISISIPDSNVDIVTTGIAKQLSTMSGGFKTCYLASLTAQGKVFNVQVDTGSSDTVLPATILNNYTGPAIFYSSSMGTTALSDHYADTSYWAGYQTSMVIGISGTSQSATANIALMTQQSTNPIFADGASSNGLIGLAFPVLAAIKSSPQTVMDAFYNSGKIAQKQVAIHGCRYSEISQAYIDIGNTSPFTSCSNVSATITMPYKSYYTVDVRAVYIGGALSALPSTFQSATVNQYGGRYWSFMDSCNSDIGLPQSVLANLQTALANSGGLPYQLTSSGYLSQWLNGEIRMSVSSSSFNWAKLPTLAFNVSTGGLFPTIVQFVLGPQQYIQADSTGYCE